MGNFKQYFCRVSINVKLVCVLHYSKKHLAYKIKNFEETCIKGIQTVSCEYVVNFLGFFSKILL